MAIVFASWEAGAATWMAPVWRSLQRPLSIFLAPAAAAALARTGMSPPHARPLTADFDWPANATAVVASASGRAEEVEAIARAKKRGLPILQIIDTWDNYAGRFPTRSWPERITVIDVAAEAEAIHAGLPAERLLILGHPGWEAAPRPPLGDPAVALFVGQPVAARRGRALGYDEHDAWNAMVEACEPDTFGLRKLIYLAHPEETAPQGNHVSHDPYGSLAVAGTVVGMFSAFLVDALLASRRVISLQPGLAVADPCGLSRHGYIPLATSVDALRHLFTQANEPASGLERIFAGSVGRAKAAIESLVA